jgi:Fic family protein
MRTPAVAPTVTELFSRLPADRLATALGQMSGPTVDGAYLHWDQLRRRRPPNELSTEEWWLALKLARTPGRVLPITDIEGEPFTYVLTDEGLSMLHRIDRLAAGRIEAPEVITNEATRDRYLVSSLMEEAISSSLLEGAATTRQEAKQLLRSGRQPRSRGEIMVVNNYRTMQLIRLDLRRPLSVEMILDIHRSVTEGTLDDPDDAGRVQVAGERRVDVGDWIDPDVVYHRPPPAEELPRRLEALVRFANDTESDPFVHPVVRAIALHFGLAYIHPFVDGNGRTARALFYRSMLRQGFWLAEFVSISRLLYQAPVRYGRAFLHSEADSADFTYFLLHQLETICRAIDDLFAYLEAKVAEVRSVEVVLRRIPGLNHRQLALLAHAVRRPDAVYTFESHRNSHGVVYQTARADLLDLEALGLLERHQLGRQYRFFPAKDLTDRLLERD